MEEVALRFESTVEVRRQAQVGKLLRELGLLLLVEPGRLAAAEWGFLEEVEPGWLVLEEMEEMEELQQQQQQQEEQEQHQSLELANGCQMAEDGRAPSRHWLEGSWGWNCCLSERCILF